MGGLLPVASPTSKGLSSNDLCVVFRGNIDNKVIKIIPHQGYSRILFTINFYAAGNFAIATLSVASADLVNTAPHYCRIEGPAKDRVSIKKDNNNNIYICTSSINNQQIGITSVNGTMSIENSCNVTKIDKSSYDSLQTTDVALF